MRLEFLDELDRFIKENNLFGKEINHMSISNKFIPFGIKRAISKRVQETMNYNGELDHDFEILYDKNNELCLRFSFNNGKTNIILKNGEAPHLDYKYTMFNIEELMYEASYLELYMDFYNSGMDAEEAKEPEKSYRERKAIVALNVDRIMKSFTKDDIMRESMVEDEFNSVLPIIEDYIVYWYNFDRDYVDQIQNIDGRVYPRLTAFDRGIDYIQRKDAYNPNPDSEGTLYIGPKERVNEVIDYFKREDFLLSMHPLMIDIGRNEVNDQAEYKCVLYRVNDGEFKFLFEPFSGKKATKVINFKYDGELKYGVFSKFAEEYLEMSEKEVSESGYGIRIYHTSEEVYHNVLKYAILKDPNVEVSPRIKDKINKMTYDEPSLSSIIGL